MNKKVADMMVDFETLGVSRDAALLSCGIILFNREGILEEEYVEYSINGQIYDGQSVDGATVDWWRRTDKSEFNRLLGSTKGYHPRYHLNNYLEGLDYNIGAVWSRGHIDFDILNYHLDVEIPYWKSKDCRTLDVFQKMRGKNNHNALDDCRNQVEHVQGVMTVWEGKIGEIPKT